MEERMKSTAQTKRPPSKATAKQSREATPVRRAEKPAPPAKAEAPRTVPPSGNGSTPMPDLTTFGVEQGQAQAHVGLCEQCGRAYRHVVKNPKDAMALQSFGRNLAVCLAGKPAKVPA
jgi:hypothetical protein